MNIMLSSKKIILTFFILTTKLLLYAQYIEYTENSFLIPYRKDTLWGLAYEDGKLSLEPNYNYCSFEDKNGNFFIKLDSKYGVISIFDSVAFGADAKTNPNGIRGANANQVLALMVGPQGEPGVKKRKIASFISFMRRGQTTS